MDSMFTRSHREHGFSRDGLRFYSHGLQYAYEFVVAVILRHWHVFVAGEVGLRYLFAFRILLASLSEDVPGVLEILQYLQGWSGWHTGIGVGEEGYNLVFFVCSRIRNGRRQEWGFFLSEGPHLSE